MDARRIGEQVPLVAVSSVIGLLLRPLDFLRHGVFDGWRLGKALMALYLDNSSCRRLSYRS